MIALKFLFSADLNVVYSFLFLVRKFLARRSLISISLFLQDS